MKQRGRKSKAAELTVVKVEGPTYPNKPTDLLPDELELWNAIVMSREPDFFDAATLPLLSEYCRLKSTITEMTEQIEAFESEWLLSDDGVKRYDKLSQIRDRSHGRMIALARSMRLTQQARYVPHKAGNRPKADPGKPKPWQREA